MPQSKGTESERPADSEPPPLVVLPITDPSAEEQNRHVVQHPDQGSSSTLAVASVLNVLESPRKGPVHCHALIFGAEQPAVEEVDQIGLLSN